MALGFQAYTFGDIRHTHIKPTVMTEKKCNNFNMSLTFLWLGEDINCWQELRFKLLEKERLVKTEKENDVKILFFYQHNFLKK